MGPALLILDVVKMRAASRSPSLSSRAAISYEDTSIPSVTECVGVKLTHMDPERVVELSRRILIGAESAESRGAVEPWGHGCTHRGL